MPRVPADDHGRRKSDDDLRQAIALFRYGVIADPVHLPVGTPGTVATMRAKAERSYAIPGSNRTRVAAETMRGWIADYRRGGFEALYPKPRTDRGKSRRLPAEIAERPIALKTANPGWSVRIVRAEAWDRPRDRLRAIRFSLRHRFRSDRHAPAPALPCMPLSPGEEWDGRRDGG